MKTTLRLRTVVIEQCRNVSAALTLSIMLLSPLLFLGDGLGVRCFAQANGTGAGNCLSYDGVSNYVDYGDIAVANFGTNDFTIEFWIKTTSSSSPVAIMSKRSICTYESSWSIRMEVSGIISLEMYTNGSGDDPAAVGSIVSVNDGYWHHIVFTRVGLTSRCYFDGVLRQTYVGTGTTNISNTTSVLIAQEPCVGVDGTIYFNGQMDEVRIWDTARTETEIRDNMCKKLTGGESGLVGYWRFDEGSGGTAYDASPNGNNGTLY